MSLEVSTEHKGYLIRWDDFCRSFTVSLEGKEVKRGISTLEDCEKWINAKCKQKFKRIPVLVRERWGNKTSMGEATSAIDVEYVWVVAKNGERNKIRAADAWLATPTNIEVLKQIQSKESEIERLKSEILDMSNGAERLTVAMMADEP